MFVAVCPSFLFLLLFFILDIVVRLIFVVLSLRLSLLYVCVEKLLRLGLTSALTHSE